MCDKDWLVGYLYGDLAASDRAAFEAHATRCADCRRELAELRQTRQHLAAWSPPEPEFNFTVVQSAGPAARPDHRPWAAVPRWGLAAAASLLVLAGAAAIANLEIRYGTDGLVVRTGWGMSAAPADASVSGAPAAPGPAAAAVPADSRPASSEQLRADLAMLGRRLQELEKSQAAHSARLAAASRPGITAAELRKVLAESESRQRTEMALQIAQVWKDFTATRASDFMRVQQTLGPELQRQQRSIENLMYRAATQK